jgi:hypothetical protein
MIANRFREDIERRLDRLAANRSSEPLTWAADRGEWVQRCDPARASAPGLLQNLELLVDVTDKGLKLVPLLADGRFYARVEPDAGAPPTQVAVGPGQYTVEGDGWRMTVRLPGSLPGVALDLETGGTRSNLRPFLLWPSAGPPEPLAGAIWLPAASLPAEDETVARNNSELADPRRPGVGGTPGLLLVDAQPEREDVGAEVMEEPVIIAERTLGPGTVHRLGLPQRENAAPRRTRLWLVVCRREHVGQVLGELPRAAGELDRWRRTGAALRFHTGDVAIDRMTPFSLHNSLFSRARRHPHRTFFVHGRLDRGYGDCAKPHQSYQMHLPALAAGEGPSVLEDILVHLELQSGDGALRRSPRPGSGSHPYAAPYSTAHLLLALHRYLCWTGDGNVLDRPVEDDGGHRRTVGERAELAATWLWAGRQSGLVPPCGWLDAWPPGVVAQAQISITTALALRRYAHVLAWAGDEARSNRWVEASGTLSDRIRDVFYRPATGLFAEHLLDDGTVIGGDVDDFLTPTQVWAALAGLAPDTRGLDRASSCLRPGLQASAESRPLSPLRRPLRSTDGFRELALDSTRTWELACWPELTHLYAIAELELGRADRALEAVLGALPEALRRVNPAVLPYFYAEKYLTPGLTPWLCTWAGDPTLLEFVLAAFGVRPDLDRMVIAPRLPAAWRARRLRAIWQWRGSRLDLRIHPHRGRPSVEVDGEPCPDGVIPAPPAARDRVIEVF